MTRLADFEQSVLTILSSNLQEQDKIPRIRTLMREALTGSEFVMSCIERALDHFEQAPDLKPQPPLLVSLDQQFAAHLIYWPPHHKNSPHMHSTWGVTGVFHNEMVFETYDNAGDLEHPELTVDNHIEAVKGETGYLLPSCIHNVANESDKPSASLHLFGTDDMQRPAECTTVWFGDATRMPGELRPRAMAIFTDILLGISGEEAEALMTRVFALAGNKTKLRLVQGLSGRNIALSYRLSVALEQALEGSDRERLAAINNKLSQQVASLEQA
ncbi:hypothetical protein [Thalassomonas actiniarum]|uniref:Cysteine dioxygenase n=1 Tax=Thalassomonas actiniarum TaxID=485447 RepID=A0AAE9YVY9_9GAMM|nr:hypothetical protein [Thalassomonas actiniarum]WDE02276.1 hypothetical protein SG35_031475 [Thalassomonas actiniarum]